MLYKVLFICFAGCALAGKNAPETSTAETESGPVSVTPSGTFKGSWMTSRRRRGLQGRPVRGAAGWSAQPPKLILKYEHEVDASKDGPACPQITPAGYYTDEDCLTINVYTPDHNSRKPLPVIVFIHAGGFYSFSGRSDVAGPHYLLDKDIVLVTFNYRLGTLGFLSTGDELAPGNNGMKDQVAALKWVQSNIRAFGGDPGLVTIAGCSAGSTSVMLHMISPMSKGLFHRGISVSGSPTGKGSLPHHQYTLAVKQAELLGCPTNNSSTIVGCLKTKSWQEMGGSLLGFFEFGFDPVSIWRPVVEEDFGQERFLPLQPVDAIRERHLHAVPHMISQTTDEFFWKAFTILKNETLLNEMNENWNTLAPISFMLPRAQNATAAQRLKEEYLKGKKLVNDTDTAIRLGKLYGDAITGFHVHRMANLMCRHSPDKVFYYEFAHIGNHSHYEHPVTKKPTAAAHHDDLIYLFSLSYRFPMIPVDDSLDSQLVDRMTALWYNFARYGDPNPHVSQPELSSLHWPAMTPPKRQYLRIGDQFSVHAKMFEDRFKIWDELYPIQY
ncbi:hypothetical protein ABMA27_009691 [Loxostege sticticalis]|uniref:Carboxylic ester hydrolase n=1 Tax=Loxostege sticticalis TaxID=481309 RepID=A0ABR3H637_LOXSC